MVYTLAVDDSAKGEKEEDRLSCQTAKRAPEWASKLAGSSNSPQPRADWLDRTEERRGGKSGELFQVR